MPRKGIKPKNPRGRQTLKRGERKAINDLKAAKEVIGKDDPICAEAESIILRIARGELRHRYIETRYRAASDMLRRKMAERETSTDNEDIETHEAWLKQQKQQQGKT